MSVGTLPRSITLQTKSNEDCSYTGEDSMEDIRKENTLENIENLIKLENSTTLDEIMFLNTSTVIDIL